MISTSEGQIAFDSGTYNFGLAFGEAHLTGMIPVQRYINILTIESAGQYIVVLSTFTTGQLGKAALEISSTGGVELSKIPAMGAGMHLKQIEGSWLGDTAAGGPSFKRYWANPTYEIRVDRSSELMFVILSSSLSPNYQTY